MMAGSVFRQAGATLDVCCGQKSDTGLLLTTIDQYSPALLSLPLISALIGWVTNYIAIKMLFHPRRPIRLGFFTVQGILPRRQADIAVQLGRVVATDLLASEDLVERLTDDRSRDIYRDFIDEQAERFIDDYIHPYIPFAWLVLGQSTVARLKGAFLEVMMEKLPDLIDRLTREETGSLNVGLLVEERVRGFSTDRLERMLHDILAREFRFIEILGAVLGFVIGVLQMLWIFLVAR